MTKEQAHKNSSCPSDEELAQFVDGTGSNDSREIIEGHIDKCESCRFVVNSAARSSIPHSRVSSNEKWDSKKAHTSVQATLEPGQTIDQYVIIEKIGRGGMGTVYLARDVQLSRLVALKFINLQNHDDNEAVLKFIVEAQTTARFNHPNIVTIHGVGKHLGKPYIALEYLRGQTLRSLYDDGIPSITKLLQIAQAIASALKESHAHGILHRDLKPENVFITDDGQIRVLDFGLAHQVSLTEETSKFWLSQSEQIALSQEGTNVIVGTPLYLAPELFQGETVCESSDIWALGIMLFEGITGHHPYEKAQSFKQLVELLLADEAAPSIENERASPKALVGLVVSCLSKEAERRPKAVEIERTIADLLGLQNGEHIENQIGPIDCQKPSVLKVAFWIILSGFFSWLLMFFSIKDPSWILYSIGLASDAPGWIAILFCGLICLGLSAVAFLAYRFISRGVLSTLLYNKNFIIIPATGLFFVLYHYLILLGRTKTHLLALHSYSLISVKQAREMTSALVDTYLNYLGSNVLFSASLIMMTLIILFSFIFVKQNSEVNRSGIGLYGSKAKWVIASIAIYIFQEVLLGLFADNHIIVGGWSVTLIVLLSFLLIKQARDGDRSRFGISDSKAGWVIAFIGILIFQTVSIGLFLDNYAIMGGWAYSLDLSLMLTTIAVVKCRPDLERSINLPRKAFLIGTILSVAALAVACAVGYQQALEAIFDFEGNRESRFSEHVNPFMVQTMSVQFIKVIAAYSLLALFARKKILWTSNENRRFNWKGASVYIAIFVFASMQVVIPFSVMKNADQIWTYYRFEKMVPGPVEEPSFYMDKSPQSLSYGSRALAEKLRLSNSSELNTALKGYSICQQIIDDSLREKSQAAARCLTANEARMYCEGVGKRLPTPDEWEETVGKIPIGKNEGVRGLRAEPIGEWTMEEHRGQPKYYVKHRENAKEVPDTLKKNEFSKQVGFRCAYSF